MQVNLNTEFPEVTFSQGEQLGIKEYAEVVVAKKKEKGEIFDRVTSEMGEAAVDIIMEKLDLTRLWSRGRIHYDFSNTIGDLRLEVKTRKKYLAKIYDLDVRLDKSEFAKAKEATHLVPLIFEQQDRGAKITSPGTVEIKQFIAGIAKHYNEIPKVTTLKRECYRVPWYMILENPKDFNYSNWKDFAEYWRKR